MIQTASWTNTIESCRRAIAKGDEAQIIESILDLFELPPKPGLALALALDGSTFIVETDPDGCTSLTTIKTEMFL